MKGKIPYRAIIKQLYKNNADAGVCLWAVHGATELRVFTVVAFCAAWSGGGVL